MVSWSDRAADRGRSGVGLSAQLPAPVLQLWQCHHPVVMSLLGVLGTSWNLAFREERKNKNKTKTQYFF